MNKKDMFIREKIQKDKEISDRANKIFDNIKGEFKLENNEKKVIKISFNTFLAITACLIIVGFVGINIYANSLGKPNIISGIQALIKDELDENSGKNYLDDETAKVTIQSYLNIIGEQAGSPAGVLAIEEIGLIDKNSDILFKGNANKDNYKSTNIKYEDFKNKMLEYMSQDLFKEQFSTYFKDIKGELYIFDGGATGIKMDVSEVELISSDEGVYKYGVKGIEYPPEEGEDFEAEIQLKYGENDRYTVYSCEWK